MRTRWIATCLLFIAATATYGETDHDMHEWMEQIGAKMGPTRKAIDAKSTDEVVKNTAELDAIYAKVEKFWVDRKTEDAVAWSKEARVALAEVSTAAKSGGDAAASWSKFAGTCRSCHNAHRGKDADGKYFIK